MKPSDFAVGSMVVYVPMHANGDITHDDAEHGVVSSINDSVVFVRFNAAHYGVACRPDSLRVVVPAQGNVDK